MLRDIRNELAEGGLELGATSVLARQVGLPRAAPLLKVRSPECAGQPYRACYCEGCPLGCHSSLGGRIKTDERAVRRRRDGIRSRTLPARWPSQPDRATPRPLSACRRP